MQDNRTGPRRRVPSFPVPVTRAPDDEPIGVVLNLSLAGAHLRAHEAQEVGSRHPVRLHLDGDEIEATTLDLTLQVVYCRRVSHGGGYEVGVEFCDSLDLERSRTLSRFYYERCL